jgi:uncharacterized protein (DUF697 family)
MVTDNCAAAKEVEVKEVCEEKNCCRCHKAEDIVRKHMLVALGTGIVPPIADIAALSAVQIRMLYLLAENYQIKFKNEIGVSVIGTFIGSYGMANIATSTVYSLMKMIPGIGTIAGGASMAVVASASTYALGKVFISHFEAGGTLLDFSPEKMREYYYEQYKMGESMAKESQKAGK